MQWLINRNIQLISFSLKAKFGRRAKEHCLSDLVAMKVVCKSTLQSFELYNPSNRNVGSLQIRDTIPVHCVIDFLTACRNLQTLDLYMNGNLQPTDMIALAPSITQITDLNISWTNIRNDAVIVLSSYCHNLVCLNLCGVDIYDTGIVALTKNCKNINSLYMNFGCSDITDTSLTLIGEAWPSMKNLSLIDCIGLTNIGFGLLANILRNLRSFNCGGVPINDCSNMITLIKTNPLLEKFRASNCLFTYLEKCQMTICLSIFSKSIQFYNVAVHDDLNDSATLEHPMLSNIFLHARLSSPK